MDENQLERMGEVVEDKKRRSKAASEATGTGDAGSLDASKVAEQPSRIEAGRPQDTRDPRAKNTRKGKITADKWNQ